MRFNSNNKQPWQVQILQQETLTSVNLALYFWDGDILQIGVSKLSKSNKIFILFGNKDVQLWSVIQRGGWTLLRIQSHKKITYSLWLGVWQDSIMRKKKSSVFCLKLQLFMFVGLNLIQMSTKAKIIWNKNSDYIHSFCDRIVQSVSVLVCCKLGSCKACSTNLTQWLMDMRNL